MCFRAQSPPIASPTRRAALPPSHALTAALTRALTLHHDVVIASLVGLMAGSLRVLWPWPHGIESVALAAPDSDVLPAILIALAAFAVVIVVARFAQRLEAGDHPASTAR